MILDYQEDIDYNNKALEEFLRDGMILRRTPYPALTITRDHLNELRKQVYELFCNWVLDEVGAYETQDSLEPEQPIILTKKFLLGKYEDLGQWMDDEPSGPEHIFHHYVRPTFIENVQEICSYLTRQMITTDIPDDAWDSWLETNLVDYLESSLSDSLVAFCRHIATSEAWDLGQKFTLENRNIKVAKQKLHRQECDVAREVVVKLMRKHCPDVKSSLDLNNKDWITPLKNATYLASDEELAALKLVGYPFSFSNRAQAIIQDFLKERIKERFPKVMSDG